VEKRKGKKERKRCHFRSDSLKGRRNRFIGKVCARQALLHLSFFLSFFFYVFLTWPHGGRLVQRSHMSSPETRNSPRDPEAGLTEKKNEKEKKTT
jgi:hypothetical protein